MFTNSIKIYFAYMTHLTLTNGKKINKSILIKDMILKSL